MPRSHKQRQRIGPFLMTLTTGPCLVSFVRRECNRSVAVAAVAAVVEAVEAAVEAEADGAAAAAEAEEAPLQAEEEAEPELVSSAEEEAVDASAPEELPEARSGSASVQWVVTKKMQARLSELGYTEEEITQLDPERAAAIIRRGGTIGGGALTYCLGFGCTLCSCGCDASGTTVSTSDAQQQHLVITLPMRIRLALPGSCRPPTTASAAAAAH